MSTTQLTRLGVTELAALSPEQVADLIGIPLTEWPGSCYGVATALVEHGLVPEGSRAVYGHWIGPIAPTSMFAARRSIGFTGHGWVLTDDGQVIDPTRYVFEDAAPYVYVGGDPNGEGLWSVCRTCGHLDDEHEGGFLTRCAGGDQAGYDCGLCIFESSADARLAAEQDEYDEGGNRFRSQNQRPFPEAGSDAVITAAAPAPTQLLLAEHGHPGGGLTAAQLFWLANLPLDVLAAAAADTYAWLIDHTYEAYIPYDNKVRILG